MENRRIGPLNKDVNHSEGMDHHTCSGFELFCGLVHEAFGFTLRLGLATGPQLKFEKSMSSSGSERAVRGFEGSLGFVLVYSHMNPERAAQS